jgi:Fe-S cluster assembly ATP-binding protein
MTSLLCITDLHAEVGKKEILHGISLTINEGELHAIMGPNGSGKSTLVNTLMGHPAYTVTKGTVLLRGKDLLAMAPHERAEEGLFLAFQYPKEIAGVTLRSFLFAAFDAQMKQRDPRYKKMSPIQFRKHLEKVMKELKMDSGFAERSVNQGFSGGEKKKAEILQMKILQPKLALLDETDSGLDIDALKIVAEGVNTMRFQKDLTGMNSGKGGLKPTAMSHPFSALLVTHYARILNYITPDTIHVMLSGTIVESGGPELAKRLEAEGYEKIRQKKTIALS